MPRSTSKLKAWDIYAKELRDLGFGHPLWVPEPSPESGEVRLGDVGYLSQGKFCFLFNCMRPVDDPVNRKGVPEGFKVFVPPDGTVEESAKGIRNCIMNRMIVSGHARAVNVEASASFSADPVAHAEGAVSYKVEQETGACLALKRPAHQTSLHCNEAIFRYLAAHHKEWRTFAIERRGRKIDIQNILFVFGFVKTAAWAVGAFKHGSSSATLKIDAGAMFGSGPSASVGAAISVSDCSQPMSFYRNGPEGRLPWQDDIPHADDQCLFLQYAHLKHRFFNWQAPRRMMTPDYDSEDDDLLVWEEVLPEELGSVHPSHAPISLHEYEKRLSEEGVGLYSDYTSSGDEDESDGDADDGVQYAIDDSAVDDEDSNADDVTDDDTDDDVVDEEVLDYILQHGDGVLAGATSQDLYNLRQARHALDMSADAAKREMLPGFGPIQLDFVYPEERPEVVGGEEGMVTQILSPSIGILPS